MPTHSKAIGRSGRDSTRECLWSCGWDGVRARAPLCPKYAPPPVSASQISHVSTSNHTTVPRGQWWWHTRPAQGPAALAAGPDARTHLQPHHLQLLRNVAVRPRPRRKLSAAGLQTHPLVLFRGTDTRAPCALRPLEGDAGLHAPPQPHLLQLTPLADLHTAAKHSKSRGPDPTRGLNGDFRCGCKSRYRRAKKRLGGRAQTGQSAVGGGQKRLAGPTATPKRERPPAALCSCQRRPGPDLRAGAGVGMGWVYRGGGGGTRPRYSVVCLWRRLLAYCPL